MLLWGKREESQKLSVSRNSTQLPWAQLKLTVWYSMQLEDHWMYIILYPPSSCLSIAPAHLSNLPSVPSLSPVYSANRGMVEVLPLLNLKSGEVELAPFRIGVKHPVRNVMELCLNLSSNDAVLPVLIALMVHCERQHGREQFQVRVHASYYR